MVILGPLWGPFGPFLTHSGVYGHFYALFGPSCGGHQRCVQAQVRWGTYKKIWSQFESIFWELFDLAWDRLSVTLRPFWWTAFEPYMVRLGVIFGSLLLSLGGGRVILGFPWTLLVPFCRSFWSILGPSWNLLAVVLGQLGALSESVLGLFGKFLGPLGP